MNGVPPSTNFPSTYTLQTSWDQEELGRIHELEVGRRERMAGISGEGLLTLLPLLLEGKVNGPYFVRVSYTSHSCYNWGGDSYVIPRGQCSIARGQIQCVLSVSGFADPTSSRLIWDRHGLSHLEEKVGCPQLDPQGWEAGTGEGKDHAHLNLCLFHLLLHGIPSPNLKLVTMLVIVPTCNMAD